MVVFKCSRTLIWNIHYLLSISYYKSLKENHAGLTLFSDETLGIFHIILSPGSNLFYEKSESVKPEKICLKKNLQSFFWIGRNAEIEGSDAKMFHGVLKTLKRKNKEIYE